MPDIYHTANNSSDDPLDLCWAAALPTERKTFQVKWSYHSLADGYYYRI